MSYDFKSFAIQGWQCPVCGAVYSPSTPMCYNCTGKTTTTTNTTTKHENNDWPFRLWEMINNMKMQETEYDDNENNKSR